MTSTENMTKEERIEYWEMVIDEFSQSGLTKAEYCRNNDIPVSTLNYWVNRQKTISEEDNGNRFVELKLSNGASSDMRIMETNGAFVPELAIDYRGLRILINTMTPSDLLTGILGELGYA